MSTPTWVYGGWIALASPAAKGRLVLVCGFLCALQFTTYSLNRDGKYILASASMSPSSQEIVRSYRSLFRHALHAVQYSSPARFTIKDVLGTTFRAGHPLDFEPQKIKNTLEFLSCAAKERGLEHKILKSLLITWWWENKSRPTKECVSKSLRSTLS